MTTVIVLFNLQADADRAAYERWARETDLPTVRELPSCRRFDALRVQGLLGGGEAPYQYVEVIQVSDLAAFRQEVAGPLVQQVAAEFRGFAADPVFMVAEGLEP